MSVYYISPIFFSPDLFFFFFLIKMYNILKNDIFTCSCWASVENGLLLYRGFRCSIDLPMQSHELQLYTFRVQELAFFYLGSQTIKDNPDSKSNDIIIGCHKLLDQIT